jgi:ABC-type phosphate transport system substrate-binding protein
VRCDGEPQLQNITVVHRTSGSSSTAGTTEYLLAANADAADASGCQWELGTGGTVTWPADTVALGVDYVDGSDGMAAYLEANPYSIGYLDFGHGHALGLSEVALQNSVG